MLGVVYVALLIVALRNEKGSYNAKVFAQPTKTIVALRNEKGSYNKIKCRVNTLFSIIGIIIKNDRTLCSFREIISLNYQKISSLHQRNSMILDVVFLVLQG